MDEGLTTREPSSLDKLDSGLEELRENVARVMKLLYGIHDDLGMPQRKADCVEDMAAPSPQNRVAGLTIVTNVINGDVSSIFDELLELRDAIGTYSK